MTTLIPRPSLFDDIFRDLSTGFLVRPLHGEPLPSPGQIRIDVKDTDDAFVVLADLPGVRKEDIQVQVDNGVVTIGAEISQQDEAKHDGRLMHSERYVGSVSRSFTLPGEVDQSGSRAKYDNGVLTLTLPKAKVSKQARLHVE